MAKRIAVVAVAVLALAACGSSSSSGSGGTGGSTNSGKDDFASLLAQNKQAKYKVTYQSGSDAPFTIAQDPPRFSYSSGTSSTYVLADGSAASCFNGGGPPTSGAPTCTEIAASGSAIQQFMTSNFGAIGALFVENASKGIPGLGSIATKSGKTIAGRDAQCATLDKNSLGVFGASLGGASYTVCLDKETGVMLSSKADNGKGEVNEITATAFGVPTDADLTPPATPGTLPDIPGVSTP